jgi:hypothetical protein
VAKAIVLPPVDRTGRILVIGDPAVGVEAVAVLYRRH